MERSPSDAPQRFVISHHAEEAFKADGLRPYSVYRDLGVAAATNGLAQAHVIRMTAPFAPSLSARHRHNVRFQMVYCLRGWFQTDFEASGPRNSLQGPAGCSHLAFGTPWSGGLTIASCSKSSCQQSSRRSAILEE
jgi:hypothetical protein